MRTAFLIICAAVLLMTGCGGEQNANSNAKYAEKIVIGIDEFAPMGFHDEKGNVVGFDVDLAKEAARRMGIEAKFEPINWNNKKAELTSGRIDLIWNGLDIMDEYKEYMIFSKPYMDNRQILLVSENNPKNIRSVGDLAGKVVATQSGSNSETYIDENENLRKSFAEFKTYPNIKAGFELLSNGEVDALIIDEIAGRYEVSKDSNKFAPVEVTVGPVTEFGIGFRKEDAALRDRVQRVFDSMIADGTARKISEQWFHADLIKSRK